LTLSGSGPYLRPAPDRVKWRNCDKLGPQRVASMLGTQPIFTIHAELEPIMNLGHTPYGERRIIGITGGTVRGARLNGRVLPGGADWQIIRSDGAADIQARYTIEADSGARILVTSDGLRHGPPDVMKRLAAGDSVDPSLYYFRTAMRFETADGSAGWLNRIVALARGAREAQAVRLDVYEVE
jgi:hypothetical protein